MSDLIFTEKVSGATPPVGKRTLFYKLDGKLYTRDSSGSETSFPTLTDIAAAAYATVNGVQTLTNKTLTSPVINSPTGIVKGDVGLGNADNTSDVNKPVSTAQAAADTAALNAARSYADGLVVGLLDDRGNYNASTNVFPTTGGSGAAGAILKGDLWSISIAGTLGGVAVTTGDVLRALVDAPGSTSTNWVITENNIGYVAENSANKNATGGYAGLTGFSLNLRNAANTITSFFSTAATVARTWTMPDKTGTVAMTSDITGTNSGTNTGDQDLSAVVTLTGTQTLTNKTLTSPTISTPTGLTKTDVGLANVDNTSDLAKPLSTADNAALALKANLAGPTFTGTVSGITKTMVGLGAVDNTSDATKNSAVATLTNKSLATEVVPIVVNNLPSSRPTLNLDFINSQVVNPRITFTRASTATRINARGLIESVLSNVPRISFDPVTLACRGLLIEEQRTNLVLNSDTLSTQSVTVTAVAHTLTFYGTGTVTLSGVSTAGPLVGTGLYPNRVSLTFTPAAGSLTLTISGLVTSGQLEAGAFATSYTPTVASQVTRAADVATMTGANFSSWYNQAEGTFSVGFDHLAPSSPGFDRVFEVNDNTFNNNITLVKNNGLGTFFTSVSVGGVNQASLFTTAMTAGVAVKTALAYKLNDFAQSHNGATVTTDSLGTVPTVTQFGFCSSGGGVSPHNGHIQSLAYFSKRLTNLELQALTTQ